MTSMYYCLSADYIGFSKHEQVIEALDYSVPFPFNTCSLVHRLAFMAQKFSFVELHKVQVDGDIIF